MPSENNRSVSRLVLFAGFAMVCLSIQYLYGVFRQPYFWDELGVYSRSSLHMYHFGLSLMPDSVPDELSRGHPLFCSFYFALAFKIFGPYPITAHIAAALLNILGFWFLYRILQRYFDALPAAIATLSVYVQALFLSQSVLILPEMPLMVCSLAAIYFYLENKIFACVVFQIIALQIKESALVLPLAFLCTEWVINRKPFSRQIAALFLIPVLSFAGFILIQYFQRGYFFYPLHTSLASFDMYYIDERWRNFKEFMVYHQGHELMFISGFLLLFTVIYKYRKRLLKFTRKREIVIPVFILGCFGFLCLNYYLNRYTLYFFVFIYVIWLILLSLAFREKKMIVYTALILVAVNGILYWNTGKKYTDIDFTYSNHIKSIQMMLEELKKPEYDHKRLGADFPVSAAFWNSENGYEYNGNYEVIQIQEDREKDMLIFAYPGNELEIPKYTDEYELYKTFRSGYAYTCLYRKKVKITP